MSIFSNLTYNSDGEQVANKLFESIKQKNKNIFSELNEFTTDIIEKTMNILKDTENFDFNSPDFIDKKTQLKSCNQFLAKLTEILIILDKKLENEITNNTSLSNIEKQDLKQEFLFDIRAKSTDIIAIRKVSEIRLFVINEKLSDNAENTKSSFLERIKSINNYHSDNNNSNNGSIIQKP